MPTQSTYAPPGQYARGRLPRHVGRARDLRAPRGTRRARARARARPCARRAGAGAAGAGRCRSRGRRARSARRAATRRGTRRSSARRRAARRCARYARTRSSGRSSPTSAARTSARPRARSRGAGRAATRRRARARCRAACGPRGPTALIVETCSIGRAPATAARANGQPGGLSKLVKNWKTGGRRPVCAAKTSIVLPPVRPWKTLPGGRQVGLAVRRAGARQEASRQARTTRRAHPPAVGRGMRALEPLGRTMDAVEQRPVRAQRLLGGGDERSVSARSPAPRARRAPRRRARGRAWRARRSSAWRRCPARSRRGARGRRAWCCEIAGWAASIAYSAASDSSSSRPSPAHAAAHSAVSGSGASSASPPIASTKLVPQRDVRALLVGVVGARALAAVGERHDGVAVLARVARELVAGQLAGRPARVERMLQDVPALADGVELGEERLRHLVSPWGGADGPGRGPYSSTSSNRTAPPRPPPRPWCARAGGGGRSGCRG